MSAILYAAQTNPPTVVDWLSAIGAILGAIAAPLVAGFALWFQRQSTRQVMQDERKRAVDERAWTKRSELYVDLLKWVSDEREDTNLLPRTKVFGSSEVVTIVDDVFRALEKAHKDNRIDREQIWSDASSKLQAAIQKELWPTLESAK